MRTTFLALLVFVALSACHRDDDDPKTPSTPVDGREKFVGHYNVYDTLGHFRYTMDISMHGQDSLSVHDWNGQFNLYIQHYRGDETNFLNLIPEFPTYDSLSDRWAFFMDPDPHFGTNELIDDTLRMSYELENIAFYTQDGVPYSHQVIREYGIKQ